MAKELPQPHSLKLLHFYEDDHDELYDLSNDLGERRNLAALRTVEVRALRDRLRKYLVSVDAQLPVPNPEYDPTRPPDPAKRGRKNNPAKPGKK